MQGPPQGEGLAEQRKSLQELRQEGDLEGDQGGLRCRRCGCCNFKVDYTRARPGLIMRKRICRSCGTHLVTHERAAGG